ncbi:MAG: nitroreductase family protein [Pseudomonadota bacterium]
MDAIKALHSRVSVNLLEDPAPSDAQLKDILKAGLRACDHKNLRPWRFLVIRDEARKPFGKLMADVMASQRENGLDDHTREKIESKPFRAPLIVVVAAKIVADDKVPEIEQIMSAAGSAQAIMTAAHALGIGAIWRSGSLMFEEKMVTGLGLDSQHKLIGFIYLGTPKMVKDVPTLSLDDHITEWRG